MSASHPLLEDQAQRRARMWLAMLAAGVLVAALLLWQMHVTLSRHTSRTFFQDFTLDTGELEAALSGVSGAQQEAERLIQATAAEVDRGLKQVEVTQAVFDSLAASVETYTAQAQEEEVQETQP